MARLSIPTTARLPSSLRVDPSNKLIVKGLNRLSRETLISLAINWLDEENVANAAPHLGSRSMATGEQEEEEEEEEEEQEEEDPDDLYPPCHSIAELQQLYIDMRQQKGSKRDVLSRILEGDWRHGLTLYQLAMVDFTHFDEHPNSHKWTAYRILPLELPTANADQEILHVDSKTLKVPRFHPSTFLQNLQRQALPDVKAHYQFYRPRDHPVLLLRIFVVESPYNTSLSLAGLDIGSGGGGGGGRNGGGGDSHSHSHSSASSRVIYLAFPDGAPSIYITKFQTAGPSAHGESRNLQTLIVKGVPNALSRPRERYTLKPINLSSKNLGALLDKCGAGRGNAAGGGWSIYADEKTKYSPLDSLVSSASDLSRDDRKKRAIPVDDEQRAEKRAKLVGKARFGSSGIVTDGKGVERVDIILDDPFPLLASAAHASQLPEEQAPEDSSDSPPNRPRRRKTIDAVIRQTVDDNDEEEDQNPGSAADSEAEWRPTVRFRFQGSHVFAGIRQLVEAGIIDGERMPGWMTGEDGVTMGVVRHGRIRGSKA